MPAGSKIMKNHGGSMWDTLFIMVKDNDEDFIMEFIKRTPCIMCMNHALKKIEKHYDFKEKSIDETRRLLWSLRCSLIGKYKDDDESFNRYIDYLNIV